MGDKDCSKEELINELIQLRKRNKELESYIKEKASPNSSHFLGEALSSSKAYFRANLEETELLQSISVELLKEDDIQALYERIIDTAMHIMHSDYASMQMFYPENNSSGKLHLLAFRGFNSKAARFWEWVDIESNGTCGEALRTGRRVIVPDVEACEFMQNTADQVCYLQTGIQAVQTTPLYSRNGRLVGMISTHWNKVHQPSQRELKLLDVVARQAADIIEHKKAEETLRASEEKYRTLFEAMNEGFFLAKIIYNESGKPVDYLHLASNPALETVCGLKQEEIAGKTIREIIKTPSPWIETFNQVAETGEPITFEGFSNFFKRTFRISAYSPRKGEFACLIQDITEQRRLEEELKHQQDKVLQKEKEKTEALKKVIEMKDEFLITISHEFKTPLNVINAALQVINKLYSNEFSNHVKKHLDKIRTNCFRQLRLVNNLLDITRYNAGHIKLQKQNLDIVFLTHAITESVMPFAKQKNVNLHFTSAIANKEIAIDEEKFERILLNLLSNAIKFTPKGKSIYVHVACKGRKILISVKDEGVGIPKDKQTHIFERFGQVDSALTRQAEGTGIGLSLVKALVGTLDGTIKLESEVENGSTFTVAFPISKIKEDALSQELAKESTNRIMQAVEIEFSDIYIS